MYTTDKEDFAFLPMPIFDKGQINTGWVRAWHRQDAKDKAAEFKLWRPDSKMIDRAFVDFNKAVSQYGEPSRSIKYSRDTYDSSCEPWCFDSTNKLLLVRASANFRSQNTVNQVTFGAVTDVTIDLVTNSLKAQHGPFSISRKSIPFFSEFLPGTSKLVESDYDGVLRTDVAEPANALGSFPFDPARIRFAKRPKPEEARRGMFPPGAGTCFKDGAKVAIAFSGQFLSIINLDSKLEERAWDLEPGDGIAISVGPDNQSLFTGGNNGMLRVWDVATGKELARWQAHEHAVTAIAAHPNGRTLLTGHADGLIKAWDIQYIRSELAKLGLDW